MTRPVPVSQARLAQIWRTAIEPAYALLPDKMRKPQADVLLLAIGQQESRFEHRVQIGGGPARSFWQCEPGSKVSRGGVWGIWLHPASRPWLRLLCEERECAFDPIEIWKRITDDDVLAAGVARLLIFTDAQPLPALGDSDAAWQLYARRCWRPGKPHPETWGTYYSAALEFVKESL